MTEEGLEARMVQIVENWSDVLGRVEAVERSPEHDAAPMVLRLQVKAVEPVAGYPNLLADSIGKSLELRGAPLARLPRAGDTVRVRVRKAGPQRHFYAEETLSIR